MGWQMSQAALIAVAAWFATAALAEIGTSLFLYAELRRLGVRVSWALYGLPGYLERLYREHYPTARVLRWRALIFLNMVAAIVAFAILLAYEPR